MRPGGEIFRLRLDFPGTGRIAESFPENLNLMQILRQLCENIAFFHYKCYTVVTGKATIKAKERCLCVITSQGRTSILLQDLRLT
jgi:hypothetical protein